MRGLLVAATIAVAGMCVAPATAQGCDGFAFGGVQQFGVSPFSSYGVDPFAFQRRQAFDFQRRQAFDFQLRLQQQQQFAPQRFDPFAFGTRGEDRRIIRRDDRRLFDRGGGAGEFGIEVRQGLFGRRGVFIR